MARPNMSDKELLEDQLIQANKYILRAEINVAAQEVRIKRLADLGCDTARSQELLEVFKTTLQAMHVHRNAILARLLKR